MIMAGIFVPFLFNTSLQIQLLMIIILQPLKGQKKSYMSKTVILSLKLENALTSSEAGVLLTALLSYSEVSMDFSSHKGKGCSLGPLGFLFVLGRFCFFSFNSLKAE